VDTWASKQGLRCDCQEKLIDQARELADLGSTDQT